MSKPISQATERELAYTDTHTFVDGVFTDPYFSEGKIDNKGIFTGSINLNGLTSILTQYTSAKCSTRKTPEEEENVESKGK